MSRAWAYTLAFNEERLIKYFVRHHRTVCERVIVYVDSDTTDATSDVAEREGAEVRIWQSVGLDDFQFAEFANAQYQEAIGQADWVIWLDADELLYHRNLKMQLDNFHTQGVNLPHSSYYVMVADHVPDHSGQIYENKDFSRGISVGTDAKTAIFNPNTLRVHWGVGKHLAIVDRNPVRDDGSNPLKILHYRWLGPEYLRERNARNYARMSPEVIERKIGVHLHPNFIGPYDKAWSGIQPDQAKIIL